METANKDIHSLIRDLQSPKREIKERAIFLLGELDDERAIYPLIKVLHEKNPGIQQTAMNALSKLKKEVTAYNILPLLREEANIRNIALSILREIGTCALPLLISLLNDKDDNIRKLIIDLLANRGDKGVSRHIIPLLSDFNANVRSAAADCLGKLKIDSAVKPLLKLLKNDPEEWVRFSAIEALGEIGDKESIPFLLNLLDKKQSLINNAVMESIGKIGDAGIIDKLILFLSRKTETLAERNLKNQAVKTVVKLSEKDPSFLLKKADRQNLFLAFQEALNDEDREIRIYSLKGFGIIKEKQGAKIILKVIEKWRDKDEEMITSIKDALHKIGDKNSLLSALKSKDEKVILISASLLGKFKVKKAISPLLALLKHGSAEIKQTVIAALGEIGPDQNSLKVLIGFLNSEISHLRAGVALSLGKSGDRKVIQPLIDLFEREPYRDVLSQVMQVLLHLWELHLWDIRIKNCFLRSLSSPRTALREMAVKGLGLMREKTEINSLILSLNDVNWQVRKAAVEALAPFNQDSAVKEAILLAFLDEHEQVRIDALIAISKLKGENISEMIIQKLEDSNLWVKAKAVELLGKRREKRAIEPLDKIIKEDKGLLLLKAIRSLGEIGDRAAFGILQFSAKSEQEEVKEEALKALKKLKH